MLDWACTDFTYNNGHDLGLRLLGEQNIGIRDTTNAAFSEALWRGWRKPPII